MSAIFDRRSVNFFDKEKDISSDLLREIINTAVKAPSAFNLQPWDIIAVCSDEAKKNLYENANQQPKILEAPVTLIVVGNREAYDEDNPHWTYMKENFGEEKTKGAMDAAAFLYGSSEERQIKFAESNAGLLAMSIMYAARDRGVDSHAMSGIDFDGVKNAFHIDGARDVVMLISLGYHDTGKSLFPQSPRREFDEVVKIA